MKQSPDSGQEKGPGLVDQSNDPSNEFSNADFTSPKINTTIAEAFLRFLDPTAQSFTFQVFDDNKRKKNSRLAGYIHGPLELCLLRLQDDAKRGCGIFVMVNAGDGSGRNNAAVRNGRIRAIWQDDDDGFVGEYPLEPHIVVETSPGKFQRIWRVEGLAEAEFKLLMNRMVAGYGSDKNAKDLARVLRLPGTLHQKDPKNKFRVTLVSGSARAAYTAEEIIEAFQPMGSKPRSTNGAKGSGRAANDGPNSTRGSNSLDTPPKRAAYVDSDDWELGPIPDYIKARIADTTRELMNSALGGVDGDWDGSLDELKSALWAISPDDQEVWSAVAFDLYPLGEIGLGLFLKWSEECDRAGKWDRDAAVEKWNDKACTWSPEEGTGRAKVIFKKARENGWVSPGADRHGGITDPNFIGGEPEPEELTLVEFPAPYPGFMANTVAAVLQAAHKPQPRLTTLAVLVGMASACDGRVSLPDGGRLNLYALGIAETAGGKDAPRSAAEDIARAVGAKTIGGLASGQGLEDALPEAGAAFMGVDEIGHDLRNISQGKAPTHLVEAHKVLLKLYTVSNGVYQTREKAATKGNPKSRMLTNPCLNVLGFTTPSTLSSALSTESIESGLLGRFLFAVGDLDVRQRLSLKEREIDKTMMSALTELNRNSRPGRRRIMISEDIEASLQKMVDRIHDEQVATEDPIGRSLLGRTFEKVMRVAGILAFWDSIPTPKDETVNEILSKVVDEDGPAPADIGMRQAHLDWAERLVRASNAALLQFAKDRIHDDEIQANAAKITRLVNGIVSGKYKAANTRHRGLIKKKLAPRQLCLNRARLNATQFDIALKHAEAAGMLVSGELKEEGERLPIAWLAIPQDD